MLGGNVNTIRPVVDAKYFRPSPWKRSHILAFHGMASMLMGYGGKVAPPFSRTYIGGEQDIRGFDIWGIGPFAFVPSSANVQVLNSDGSARTQKVVVDGVEQLQAVTMSLPIYQMIFPGGDTQIVTNFEYRIPIVGPVVLAFFADWGLNKIVLTNQLRMEASPHRQLERRVPAGGFRRTAENRSRHPAAAHVHRRRVAGHAAGSERAVPDLLGVQPAWWCSSSCSRPSWPTGPFSRTRRPS